MNGTTPMAHVPRILIVEDEVLIADTLKMNLERNGYSVTETAISYEEAIASLQRALPSAVLLDIRLSGERTGIEVGTYLNQLPQPPPFIYLTSQMDEYYLELAKRTHPAGYLGKPLQLQSLLATLKMVLYNSKLESPIKPTIELKDGSRTRVIDVNKVCHLKAEHVYVKVYTIDGESILHRGTLSELTAMLNAPGFVQTHRSHVVNLAHVTGFDTGAVYIGNFKIPVSRARRREVFGLFKSR